MSLHNSTVTFCLRSTSQPTRLFTTAQSILILTFTMCVNVLRLRLSWCNRYQHHISLQISLRSRYHNAFLNLRSKLGVSEPPATSLKGCVSDNEPKTEVLLSIMAQQKTQDSKMGLEQKDKQSILKPVANDKAAQRSCRNTVNTTQQIQLFNRFDSLVC